MGQSPNSENYTENPSDYILVQGNADMKDGRVVPRVWTTQVTKTADKGDLILSVRAPVGDIGKTDYDVVLGRGVAAIKGNEFLFQSLGRMKQNGYWTKLSTGSTFESINSNDIKEAQILLPSLEEQQKIGTFFKTLDNTITLHQRRCEQTKELKKFMLQKMFPKKGEKNPEIRFPGFTDAWEQRKLGNVAKITMGQSPNSENYTENPSDYILVQGNADMKDGRVVPRVWTTQVTKTADKGDLILSVRAPVGDIGKTDYDVVLGRGVAAIKGNEFLFQSLGRMKQNGYWTKLSTGSTFESINSNDIKEAQILLPSLEEQQKIGTFFKTLDNTITLHQRRCEQTKELKKFMLQKMFPKKGEKNPEIRFPGFTDAWEQRKLGNVAKITMGQSPNSENYTENPSDYILVQGNADMKDGRVVPRVWTTQVTKTADKGDLILSVRAPVGDIGKTDYDVVLGRGVAAIKGNEFLFQSLGRMKQNGYWTKLSTGSTFESINSNDIKEAQILLPSLEEQQKIGTFFKTLDNTITLHQRKDFVRFTF
ncbi:Type I restriction-modification system, specificity subunit S [Streptococcus macedonicus ACA-DC 198]|nr:Type I restriction-modification system, specificity subunit S [Streptococcus macedonicus ACA-DC 198]